MTALAPQACPRCGHAIPAGWVEGSCPFCLIRISIEGFADDPIFPPNQRERMLGDCEIIEEIGRGGMGVVYRARQRHLGRTVAVKVLAAGEYASVKARRRFRTEAEAAARLRHPGIVAIHDVGESDGLPWLSMDFIPGKTLAELVGERPLAARQAAEYLCAIAEAVHHAHDHGVLHRDLKPSNILLDPATGPKITDFGLARCILAEDDFESRTGTGEVMGSPGYSAPEQALGGTADVRTDVYGLGAVLYHLLTARPPFLGPTVEAILVQLQGFEAVPPRRLNPSVPHDLETICLHCLHKEPARRYAAARELAEDLGRFLRGETIRARPLFIGEKALRWSRRRPALTLALAGLVIGGLLSIWRIDVAWRAESAARRAAEEAASQLRDANAHLAESLATMEVDRAEDLFRGGDSGAALAVLAQVVRHNPWASTAVERLTSALWYGDFALPGTEPFTAGDYVEAMRLLPNGRSLLICTRHGIAVYDATTGQPVRTFDHDGSRLSFTSVPSSDGSTVAAWTVGPTSEFFLFNAITGQSYTTEIPHGSDVQWAGFSPDGTKVAVVTMEPTMRVLDVPTGRLVGGQLQLTSRPSHASFSPDSGTIAVSHGKTVSFWDATTRERRFESPSLPAEVRVLGYSPDGGLVLAGCVDGGARFLSTDDGQFAGRAIRHESQLLGASFSPDGERVLTFSLDRTARLWTVPEGDSATPPLRHRDRLNFAAFSADGRRVVTCSSDHTARVWDSFTGRPLTQPLRHAEQPTGAVFMPDGTTLLTSGADSIVRPWELRRPPSMEESQEPPFPPVTGDYASVDGRFKLTVPEGASEAILTDAQTGRPIGSPLRHSDQITAAHFSPDGALVATASKANVAQVWDTVTGRPVSPPLRHQRTVSTVVFSRNGRHLATGSWDGTAQVWDPRTGIRTGRPMVHDAYVNAVCFSPDDRRIATASSDQTARLWDSATGQPLSEPLRHSKAVVRVRFDATGEQLISQDDDRTLCAHAVPRFRTPPPPWLLEVVETIAFDPSIPDRASVLAQLARYRCARAAAVASTEPAVGPRVVVFERLARRLFP